MNTTREKLHTVGMRRLFPAFAAAALMCGLSACSEGGDTPSVTPVPADSSAVEATTADSAPSEETPAEEVSEASSEESAAEPSESEADTSEAPEPQESAAESTPPEGSEEEASEAGEATPEVERCIGTLEWQPSDNPDPEGYHWILSLENGDLATFTLKTNKLPEETLFDETFDIDPAAGAEVCKFYSSLPADDSGDGAWITYAFEPQIVGETIEQAGSSSAEDLAVKVIGQDRFNKAKEAYDKQK